MSWTFILPIKRACDRKQRLAKTVSASERIRLTDLWLMRLVEASRPLGRVTVLSPEPVTFQGIRWLRDEDRGINVELGVACRDLADDLVAVVNADLPLVTTADLHALTQAARLGGCAIAPDRHGIGTNALALAGGRPFAFAFGPGSLRLHRAAASDQAQIVLREGLALDVDTQVDLDLARQRDAGCELEHHPTERGHPSDKDAPQNKELEHFPAEWPMQRDRKML